MSRNSRKMRTANRPRQPDQNIPKPPVATQEVKEEANPFGISFVVPTEMVSLPSGGEYYPASNPLRGLKEVEIKHMTAKEEDILSSVDQTNNERLFEKLIDGLLVNKNIKSTNFTEEDKMALLLSARITGYGKDYEATANCANCGALDSVHVFDLTKHTIKDPGNENLNSVYTSDTDSFTMVAPISKIEFELKNFNEDDRKYLEEEKSRKNKHKIHYNTTISFLERVIISANSVADRKLIKKLIEVLPAADAKTIVGFFDNCRPSISTEQEVSCSNCDHASRKEVPLTWAFFRTDI